MDNAPFYVGQKVVCVDPRLWDDMKKGDVFTVINLVKCCGKWSVIININASFHTVCRHCGKSYKQHARNAKCFAPYNEQSEYTDITKELAVLPADEVPDVKKIAEPVNN